MNNKTNINPSSTKWLEKDDRVVADYFCDLDLRLPFLKKALIEKPKLRRSFASCAICIRNTLWKGLKLIEILPFCCYNIDCNPSEIGKVGIAPYTPFEAPLWCMIPIGKQNTVPPFAGRHRFFFGAYPVRINHEVLKDRHHEQRRI